jgi:threonine dehydrogenase-like Zn-dependent dehydrogenase
LEVYTEIALIAPKKLQAQELPLRNPGAGEVLIKVLYSGICSTDLAIYRGDYVTPLPLVLGHEFCGEIIGVGPGVSLEYVGQLATAEINETCFSRQDPTPCPMCLKGWRNHCQQRRVMGINSWSGAFSQLLLAPIRNVHLIPSNIPLHNSVFIEPLAAAIQTFELSPVDPGETIAVLGVGRLGNLVSQVASLMGARVIAIGRSGKKLELARQLGAWEVINAEEEDLAHKVTELTGGKGPDMVVEATGSEEGLNLALGLIRPGGIIALKTTSGLPAEIDTTALVVNEVRVQGSRCGPFPKAISLLQQEKIRVEPLISAIYPLAELEMAFQSALGRVKVLLRHC